MDSLTVQIIVTIVVGLAYVVGLTGIVLPIIPGSITILIGSLVWAIVLGGWTWLAFAIIAVLCALGMTCSYVMTGKRLKDNDVPTWPILVGVAAGIVGIFVIPFLGLPIGFILGLYGSEWYRRRDMKLAWESSWIAIKAFGIGVMLELVCGFASTLTFAIATTLHFLNS
ncbi:DUF456 domain-containing protein [Brachybacterium kimchii]|uniref:DUF456 domain-containing protein n=1 Tax=Brachybacterium kimchii TaxID=2942909 RepID=A0ABY4N2W1_9MICO|nr:DUF456 domain-containing protein [Brachybacterium kimchii]UQN28181.1 DUF456 domain-containing protein [Brachybacterium kimchii]